MYNKQTFFENLALITKQLSEPIDPSKARETLKAVTKKGYDTKGFSYQYLVNRMNDVLGVCGWRIESETFTTTEPVKRKNRDGYETIQYTYMCEMVISIGWYDMEHGVYVPAISKVGQGVHSGMNMMETQRGAKTNALKKTIAYFGPGRQIYEGSIDEDDIPCDAEIEDIEKYKRNPSLIYGPKKKDNVNAVVEKTQTVDYADMIAEAKNKEDLEKLIPMFSSVNEAEKNRLRKLYSERLKTVETDNKNQEKEVSKLHESIIIACASKPAIGDMETVFKKMLNGVGIKELNKKTDIETLKKAYNFVMSL